MLAKHNPALSLLAAFALISAASALYASPQTSTTPAPPAASEQAVPEAKSASGPILGAVRVSGPTTFSSAEILAASGLKPGQPINRGDIQAAANRLASTGLFSSVRYSFSSRGQGVDLQFQLADAPTLHVSFDYFPWFTDQELSADIRKSVGLFNGTSPESGSYVDTIGAAIQKQIQALGVQGQVEHRVIERPVGSGMEVQFRLVGVTLDVGSVQFTDPVAQKDERVKERLVDLIGKPFSRYYTDVFVAEQVRPIYLSEGYLQAQFGAPQARFSGNPNQPEPDQVLVVVPVQPGRQYTWGGIRWSGNTVFDSQALNQAMGLHAGQTADGLAIEAGWQKVRQQYGAKGYLDASLNIQPAFDTAKATVSYDVAVSEGLPFDMGQHEISGLSVNAETRVRSAWLIRAGQPFDLDYYHAFVGDVAKKALGDLPVHYEHIGRYLQRNQDHSVDVMLDFR